MRAGEVHVIRRIAMELTGLEREFLKRLAHGPWASPPLFDHSLVARLVDDGLVQTESLPGGSVQSYRRILVTEWVRRQRLELAI